MFTGLYSHIISNYFCKEKKEKIYVIGNGWGSYFFVKNLYKSKYEPIIISPNKKVLDTPKLTNRVINSNENVEFENNHAKHIEDILDDIDIENKLLITKNKNSYNYSKVVLSIGSEPNDFNIEGVNENTLKLKSIQDADIINQKLNSINSYKNVYIIGSGITGIELASKINKSYNVILIEGLNSILQGFNDLTKNAVSKYLIKEKNNITIKLNHLVKSIQKDKISVLHKNNNQNNNENINYDKNDLIIWSAGVRFNGYGKTQLYNTLNKISPIKPRGLNVNDDFSIGKNIDIFCIGDMVSNAGPPTAQNAKNQAEWLAKYFNNNLSKEYLENNKYEIQSKGKLVHLDKVTYLESKYYSGYIPNFICKMIDYFQK